MKLITSLSSALVAALSLLLASTTQAESLFAPLEKLIKSAETNLKIPGGSVRVVENRKIVFDRYFGTLAADSKTPWDDQTAVAIASISKSITATLVAILVGEGSLAFDDPISDYLPEYADLKLQKNGQSVRSPTIAECLSHTAGFPSGTMAKIPPQSPVKRGDQAEVAHHLAAQGLATRPGTNYAYTFRGYAAVSRVIEVVTGHPIAEVLQEKLLSPLSMTETTFTPDASLARRIPVYASRTTGRSDAEVTAQIKRFRARSGSFVNVAGSLFSTPYDLQRFLQFHADRGQAGDQQIVPSSVLAKLYQPQPASSKYGLGFSLRPGEIVGHGGATGTSANVDLKSGRILIVLTQAGATNARPLTAGAIRNTFR